MKKIEKYLWVVAIAWIIALFGVPMKATAADPDYLTFVAQTDNSSVTLNYAEAKSIYINLNDSGWETYSKGNRIALNKGQNVRFKGQDVSTDQSNHFVMEGKITATGSVNSLVDMNGSNPNVSAYRIHFSYMFCDCKALETAPKLPAAEVSASSYGYMFKGCTGLTQTPRLPATTLSTGCYQGMFEGCTSLTKIIGLPATTLADRCYSGMFENCTALTQMPELPAQEIPSSAYYNMFSGCTSLKNVSIFAAQSLAELSCYGMFNGCTSLTKTPQIQATTLKSSCCYEMFRGCTSLTGVSELPAESLANSCYHHMFYGCSSLTEAPVLPAKKLAESCYEGMFLGCTSLTDAPNLPAMDLAVKCYSHMFYSCESLTAAPVLPATELAEECYKYMFGFCDSITVLPKLVATTYAKGCYDDMFYGCSNLAVAIAPFSDRGIIHPYTLPDNVGNVSCCKNMFHYAGQTDLIPRSLQIPTSDYDIGANDTIYYAESAEPLFECTVKAGEHCTTRKESIRGYAYSNILIDISIDEGYEIVSYSLKNEQTGVPVKNIYINESQFTTFCLYSTEIMPFNTVFTCEAALANYNVVVNPTENGTVKASTEKAVMQNVVKIDATPNAGYEAVKYTVLNNSTKEEIAVNDNTFVMPTSDVTISVEFAKIMYPVTVSAIENGNLSVNLKEASFGTQILLTTTPNEGYLLEKVSVTNSADNSEIPVTDGSFTMPIAGVNICATFRKRPDTVISYSNINKTIKTAKTKYSLKAKADSGARLTYASSDSKIKVDSNGNVTIPSKWVGTAKIKITADDYNEYYGSVVTATVTVKPAKSKISKLTSGSKGTMLVKWGKNKLADGYRITYSTNKKFKNAKTVTVKKGITAKTIKKLSSKKTYYVKIETYMLNKNKKKIYSDYSDIKKVKIK